MLALDIGQIITILANLGVISGIALLMMEVKQNNRLLAAQARYGLRQYRNDIVVRFF
jgi:hypothetical protein